MITLFKKWLLVWFFVLGSVCFCSSVFSETIILKSGGTVEGKIIENKDTYVKIDFMGTVLTYDRQDIERIESDNNSVPSTEVSSEALPKDKEIKIQIKADFTKDAKEYADKLDYLGRDIQEIISSTEAEISGIEGKNLTDKHRAIMRKAVDEINKRIKEAKALKVPKNCDTLQKLFIEKGNAATLQFMEEVGRFATMDELNKYWMGYKQKIERIYGEYFQERQKTLEN